MAKKEKTRGEGAQVISCGTGEGVLYQDEKGAPALEVRLEQESLWLNLTQISSLFERDKSVISRHRRNVYRDGKPTPEATVAFFATTAADWKTCQIECFTMLAREQ